MFMARAVARNQVEAQDRARKLLLQIPMPADAQLRKKVQEGFCVPHPQNNNLDRKPSKRTLKIVIKMLSYLKADVLGGGRRCR